MQLEAKVQWTITLDSHELRLIGKALGGRLTETNDITAARELNQKLGELRVGQLKHIAVWSEKLEKNVAEARIQTETVSAEEARAKSRDVGMYRG